MVPKGPAGRLSADNYACLLTYLAKKAPQGDGVLKHMFLNSNSWPNSRLLPAVFYTYSKAYVAKTHFSYPGTFLVYAWMSQIFANALTQTEM